MPNTKKRRNIFLAVVAVVLTVTAVTGCGRREEPDYAEGNTGTVNAAELGVEQGFAHADAAKDVRLRPPHFVIPDEGITLPCQIALMYRKKYYELITSSRWEDAELSAQYFAEAAKWARKAVEMGDQDGLSMLVGLAREGSTAAEDAIRALAEDEKIPDLFREKAADYVEGYRRSGEWRPGSELEDPELDFGEEPDEEDENAENAGENESA